MNPSTSTGVTDFSPCSIGNICSAMGGNSINTTCFSNNKGVTTITGQQCGNGIVEEGEDCDCGGEESCGDNACCEPTTCKFKSGAVCDDSNEQCCSGCQFASNGTVCRSSTGTCDPAEVCTGTSGTCPADVTAADGKSCGSGLHCASGQCTSRNLQCQVAMGSYTTNNNTYACDDSGCLLSCASPQFGSNVCLQRQSYFLDGTPCSGGGKCKYGQCKGSSVGGKIRSWIEDNKGLVIGLAVGLGGLVILVFLSCLVGCCKRRRHTQPKNMAPNPPPGGWRGWDGAPPPPPLPPPPPRQMQQHVAPYMTGGGGGGVGYSAPPGWDGGYGRPPPPPPPAYAPQGRAGRYA